MLRGFSRPAGLTLSSEICRKCVSGPLSWLGALIPPLLLAGCLPAWAGSHPAHKDAPPTPQPEERIPVSPLGYRAPGALYLLSRMTFSSLDFVDSQHVLFTFHDSRLLRRANDATSSDDDEMIRAVVLGLPDGQVGASTEWRMHDRGRYLWPLSDGTFLVRERDSYSLADSSLQLHSLVRSPTPIRATEVSPDGHLLVIERELERHTPEEHQKLVEQAEQLGNELPAEDTEIDLVSMDTKTVRARMRTEFPIALPVTSSGYLGMQQGKRQDDYLIQFYPLDGKEATLGSVASTCHPRETFLNATTLMIESCGPNTSDIFLDAWSTSGKPVWRGRRDGHAIWPTFCASRNGKRFALGLLQVTHPVDLVESLQDSDVKAQVVQVFDTDTGTLLLSTFASPILTAGQNFALSPDGDLLAVLRDGAIEIYKVPAAAAVAPAAQK
jgi:hypothetical protein